MDTLLNLFNIFLITSVIYFIIKRLNQLYPFINETYPSRLYKEVSVEDGIDTLYKKRLSLNKEMMRLFYLVAFITTLNNKYVIDLIGFNLDLPDVLIIILWVTEVTLIIKDSILALTITVMLKHYLDNLKKRPEDETTLVLINKLEYIIDAKHIYITNGLTLTIYIALMSGYNIIVKNTFNDINIACFILANMIVIYDKMIFYFAVKDKRYNLVYDGYIWFVKWYLYIINKIVTVIYKTLKYFDKKENKNVRKKL